MARALAILFLLLLPRLMSPSAAHPQSVETPDTLGAAFDPGAIGKGSFEDYDFLVGTWRFHFQQRKDDGTYEPSRPGTWTVRRIHDGLVIEDVWRLDGSDNPTVTYRIWDSALERWRLQGFRPRTGIWEPGLSWSDPDHRYVVQTFDETLLARIRYYEIRPDAFRWRADGSLDGGRTWTLDWWKMDVARAE
jgi:hypothetical protein